MIGAGRTHPVACFTMQVVQETGCIIDIHDRIETLFQIRKGIRVPMQIDLHAADID